MSFIIFDVVNYYPNITQELFEKAIEWAKRFENISDEEKDILSQKSQYCILMGITGQRKVKVNLIMPRGLMMGLSAATW